MQQILKYLCPFVSINLHFPSIDIPETIAFLYFTTLLKERKKQTFKYDQMLLMPPHSRRYYSQNVIFPVNLTTWFWWGNLKETGNLEDISNINRNSSGLGWGQAAGPC